MFMLKDKRGFTLIELVMIIVILGILAAVAIPRYADLRDDANRANAKAVVGGLNSAASVAFASYLTGRTRCNSIAPTNPINTETELAGCLDGGLPTGWTTSDGNDFVYAAAAGDRTFQFFSETTSAKAYVATTSDEDIYWP